MLRSSELLPSLPLFFLPSSPLSPVCSQLLPVRTPRGVREVKVQSGGETPDGTSAAVSPHLCVLHTVSCCLWVSELPGRGVWACRRTLESHAQLHRDHLSSRLHPSIAQWRLHKYHVLLGFIVLCVHDETDSEERGRHPSSCVDCSISVHLLSLGLRT